MANKCILSPIVLVGWGKLISNHVPAYEQRQGGIVLWNSSARGREAARPN